MFYNIIIALIPCHSRVAEHNELLVSMVFITRCFSYRECKQSALWFTQVKFSAILIVLICVNYKVISWMFRMSWQIDSSLSIIIWGLFTGDWSLLLDKIRGISQDYPMKWAWREKVTTSQLRRRLTSMLVGRCRQAQFNDYSSDPALWVDKVGPARETRE